MRRCQAEGTHSSKPAKLHNPQLLIPRLCWQKGHKHREGLESTAKSLVPSPFGASDDKEFLVTDRPPQLLPVGNFDRPLDYCVVAGLPYDGLLPYYDR